MEKRVYASRQPHLDRGEFRTIYAGVGSALVVAGVAVMANWVSIVQASAPPSALRVAGTMFYVGLAVVVVGIYCFVASVSSSHWFWLPGKSAMLRAAEADSIRSEFHSLSVSTLAFARVVGLALREVPDVPPQRIVEWYTHVVRLSMDVWKGVGTQVLTTFGPKVSATWLALVQQVVDPTLLKIEGLIAQASSRNVQADIDRNDVARLRTEWECFTALWDDLVGAHLTTEPSTPGT